MATAVRISASNDIRGRRPEIGRALQELETRLNAVSEDELQAVVEGISRALEPTPAVPSDHLSELLGEPIPEAQRVKDEVEVFVRSFAHRRQLLADALTTPQVARLLNTTRQTPHDLVKSGSLLAVMDRSAALSPMAVRCRWRRRRHHWPARSHPRPRRLLPGQDQLAHPAQ